MVYAAVYRNVWRNRIGKEGNGLRIYIIRHGETKSNEQGLLQGWTDDALNENGIRLAEITGRAMGGIHFDMAYTSPLKRAWQTAQILLENSGNAGVPLVVDERIKEISMGEWEGKRFRKGECEIPIEDCERFFTNPMEAPPCPNGESVKQVCQRTQGFLKELAQKNEGNILVSTHGCALRAMLNCLYEDTADFWHGHVPYNCVVNIVEVKNGAMRLIGDDIVYYSKQDCIDRYADV